MPRPSGTGDGQKAKKPKGPISPSDRPGVRNAAFGHDFETAVRTGLQETAKELGWSARCVSSDAVVVYSGVTTCVGDIDGYLTLERDVELHNIIPGNCCLNRSGIDDKYFKLKKDTLVIYEAKTTWQKDGDALKRKDRCFQVFWLRAGRPKVLVVFLFGGIPPDTDMWTKDGGNQPLLHGVQCNFLRPDNTVFAWARTGDVYSWSTAVRLRCESTALRQAQAQIQKQQVLLDEQKAKNSFKAVAKNLLSFFKKSPKETSVVLLAPPAPRKLFLKLLTFFIRFLLVVVVLFICYDLYSRNLVTRCKQSNLALAARCVVREYLLGILDLDAPQNIRRR